jgi:hypothetical protein
MNEDALRALVRDTIARMESARGERTSAETGVEFGASPSQPDPSRLLQFTSHPSHYQYTLPPSDGPCLIEPAVPCNHCGYCQSHGH